MRNLRNPQSKFGEVRIGQVLRTLLNSLLTDF